MDEKDHFKGKEPLRHIAEVQAQGMTISSEVHGAETPGYISAFLDSLRDSLFLAAFVFLLPGNSAVITGALFLGYALWRGCRSVHLAYSRLERLHRVANEEKHEIETNRAQEKEELKALYRIKGFEGKLLDQVIEVLMADNERCLRVMLEEEMGFRLQENEHPLVQGLGGFLGVGVAYLLVLFSYWLCGVQGVVGGFFALVGISWGLSAYKERNRVVPAVVWGISEAVASLLLAYFVLKALIL